MSKMKRCQQCGLLKDVESYRPYTYAKQKGTQGRYRICRQCEAINSRYKRALETAQTPPIYASLTDTCLNPEVLEAVEIVEHTNTLYAQLSARGLRVPTVKTPSTDATTQAVDSLLEFYREDVIPTATVELSREDIPADLAHWLDSDYAEWLSNDFSPEFLQETVYESLKAKYRPQTGIDKERLLPIYDDTYKAVLNRILKRFDDFEEYMSSQDEEDTDEH